MAYNLFAFLLLAFIALALTQAAGERLAPWLPTRLLLVAVVLRVLGSTVRYEVLHRFYNGFGDAVQYFYEGREIAAQLLDRPVLLVSPLFWAAQSSWWGTPFLTKVAGVVLLFTGPSMLAGFLAFSLIAFAGLFAMARAFRNTQTGPAAVRYAAWIWLWPSLWFWPSSIGKEAVLVLGIGLTVLGYCGRRGINWPLFLAGLGLSFCIRPHVALVLAMATVIAHWLGRWERFSLRRVAEVALAVAVSLAAFVGMRAQFGLEDAGFEGMKEFVEVRAEQTFAGGSRIGSVPLGLAGIPLAFVNVWMRPFPWEAHNATAAFAALEIALFWFLVWQRRRALRTALKEWRHHRLLRFSVPFLLLYTVMIGIAFGNLGIIARQRAPIFPFMLMLLAVAPRRVPSRVRAIAAPAPPAGASRPLSPQPATPSRSTPSPAPAITQPVKIRILARDGPERRATGTGEASSSGNPVPEAT